MKKLKKFAQSLTRFISKHKLLLTLAAVVLAVLWLLAWSRVLSLNYQPTSPVWATGGDPDDPPPPPPPPGNHNLEADWFVGSTDTVTVNGTVEPGSTHRMSIQGKNTGDGLAPLAVFGAVSQNANLLEAPAQSTAQNNPFSNPQSNSKGYGVSDCTPTDNPQYNPCWYWTYNNFAAGANPNVRFNFTVKADAPAGSKICFLPFAAWNKKTDSSTSNGVKPATLGCVNVSGGAGGNTPDYPYINVEGGSVHAGSEFASAVCLTQNGNAQARGSASGPISRAAYIVSARGDISNFGSGGSGAGNSLTLGNELPYGNYGTVCRPDVAKRYLVDEPVPSLTSNKFDVNYLVNGIAKYTGNLEITGGTVKKGQRSTLVVNGNVYISGSISYESSNYTTYKDIPSLGIVATGKINISPAVSELYGIYYAGGNGSVGSINTCQTGYGGYSASSSPAIITDAGACQTALRVNGALVANNIYFRRTTNSNTGAAETISYMPQLLLQPPFGLGGVASQF